MREKGIVYPKKLQMQHTSLLVIIIMQQKLQNNLVNLVILIFYALGFFSWMCQ